MRTKGASLDYTTLSIYDNNSRGLHLSVNVKSYEIILSIPFSLSIVPGSNSKIDKIISGTDKHYQSEIFIIWEILTNKQVEKIPWMDILPKTADNFPMVYTEEERKWLEGSSCLSIFTTSNSCN